MPPNVPPNLSAYVWGSTTQRATSLSLIGVGPAIAGRLSSYRWRRVNRLSFQSRKRVAQPVSRYAAFIHAVAFSLVGEVSQCDPVVQHNQLKTEAFAYRHGVPGDGPSAQGNRRREGAPTYRVINPTSRHSGDGLDLLESEEGSEWLCHVFP